jgi:hypothetical protein
MLDLFCRSLPDSSQHYRLVKGGISGEPVLELVGTEAAEVLLFELNRAGAGS